MDKLPRWETKDVIDLEVFFAEDRDSDERTLVERDREIFRTVLQPALDHEPLSAREKVKLWLEARKAQTTEFSPGEYFGDAHRFMFLAMMIGGILAGAALAGSHLFYEHGARPINAPVFFAVTVLIQLLLLLVVSASILLRSRLRTFLGLSIVRSLLSSVLIRILEAKEKSIGGHRQSKIGSVWGALQSRRTIYGDLLAWPLLVLTQIFAVFFNLGILASLPLLVTFFNRPFGWETTLNLGPEVLHRAVRAISWCWSWLPNAHPSLAQIEASRTALHTTAHPTISNLALNDALASWWPFLFYAVLFYGLIPRVLFLIAAQRKQKRALASLRFDHADCQRLLRRMEPLIVSSPAPPARTSNAAAAQTSESQQRLNQPAILVSKELDVSSPTLSATMEFLGLRSQKLIPVEVDCAESNSEAFATLAGPSSVVVLIESSRPPIQAILLFLKDLRTHCGARVEIRVVLVPQEPESFDYREAWRDAIAGMGDAFLHLEPGYIP